MSTKLTSYDLITFLVILSAQNILPPNPLSSLIWFTLSKILAIKRNFPWLPKPIFLLFNLAGHAVYGFIAHTHNILHSIFLITCPFLNNGSLWECLIAFILSNTNGVQLCLLTYTGIEDIVYQ